MLDLHRIRQEPDRVREAIRVKGIGDPLLVDRLLALDAAHREKLTALQTARHRLNTLSQLIGQHLREGRQTEAKPLMEENAQLKEAIKDLEAQTKALAEEVEALLLEIPNVPHPSVPVGRGPEDNHVLYEAGCPPKFDFTPLPHWELAARHGLIDFERGAKVAGSGFPFYIGKGARLERALIQFFLDLAVTEGGYVEIQPPLLVNAESARGTGQLPDKEDLMYVIERDALYPIPTAEVPVTNYFRDEILEEAQLPVKFCAYSPCFRREAGSYGKEVRGLNRLHQFDKVELVQFVHPDLSYEALEQLREDAERPLRRLGLAYRRVLMCTAETGFTQAKKYDLEVWSPAQQRWLEVSSISNFEDFQARRARIRFRPAGGGKPQFVHTLNGSGLALPRVVAALLEHYQQPDGSIRIPEALQPYTGFGRIG
jgi:seryl-tRNA synthetase